ncbi:hypothetical protein FNQ90_12570 [Streptomyces alkaliphilus]|uniref:Acyl-CoA dehydrogenase/oxidase C-terminal domain-containing protein n=1 Tax=Streptomyces alkaliphilus TaxID=1472722 RepID=A0A7W3Y235_9ACTN|nr:hypothetical protein [Streptomyces alkaliphilus]MBB0244917.1 hypothetical protein [Streptomyces alkaliphilus]
MSRCRSGGASGPLPALFRSGRTARILDGPDEFHISSVARRVLRGVAGTRREG